jgi:hypothetical protein
MRLARWRGYEPRLISISGTLDIPGAEVQALDSKSGWAALTDQEGRFILPDLLWYPGASYELVISTSPDKGRLVKTAAPREFPEGGAFNVENLSSNRGKEVDLANLLGANISSQVDSDIENNEYYQTLFDRLTAGKNSDEEKVNAINDYVATKLNYDETQWEPGSPRRVLERGSQYCGHLSTAMAVLLKSGNYRTRMVNVSDGKNPPGTHVVVEVFFGDHWHLYDPTYGITFRGENGEVVGYKEVRLRASYFIREDMLTRFDAKKRSEIASLLRSVYTTGYHHYYCLK